MTAATCTVAMVPHNDPGNPRGYRWDLAAFKRATKRLGKLHEHDARVRLPRTDKVLAIAAAGRGMTWEERGRTFRAQAWSASPLDGAYWYRVWDRCANFPGEMRLVGTSDDGEQAWLFDDRTYNARGHRAHRSDGSPCYGPDSIEGGCPGCKAEHEAGA